MIFLYQRAVDDGSVSTTTGDVEQPVGIGIGQDAHQPHPQLQDRRQRVVGTQFGT